ncbi:MAG: pyridoxamine 5'-phosphate oxidase family protein [Pseudomonadota bacterium]|nr:pyridoxamine 5'-phosphate oxidase family protein [Pseudomonadota bacterium]
MDVDQLLQLARKLIDDLTFCVAATQGEDGTISARVIQPMRLQDNWTVNAITNRRCRKVREIERSGRMTLLYEHDQDKSYVCLVGRAEIVEDLELKRSIWTPGHYRWNPKGPEDADTVFMRLITDRIELWSAVHGVLPPPEGYSAAVLLREGEGWRYSAT